MLYSIFQWWKFVRRRNQNPAVKRKWTVWTRSFSVFCWIECADVVSINSANYLHLLSKYNQLSCPCFCLFTAVPFLTDDMLFASQWQNVWRTACTIVHQVPIEMSWLFGMMRLTKLSTFFLHYPRTFWNVFSFMTVWYKFIWILMKTFPSPRGVWSVELEVHKQFGKNWYW